MLEPCKDFEHDPLGKEVDERHRIVYSTCNKCGRKIWEALTAAVARQNGWRLVKDDFNPYEPA